MHSLMVAGLGRVGSADDALKPSPPRSHIGAALSTGRFSIVGLVEPDWAAAARARNQWPALARVAVHASLRDVPPQPIDLLVLATPTATREADIEAALALRPRLLIVEKPLAGDLATARRIARRLRAAGQATRIGYMRRFAPAIGEALDMFATPPIKAIASYTRGIAANCSHVVDLLVGRYGAPTTAWAYGPASAGRPEDPDIDFGLHFECGLRLHAVALDGGAFAHLDLALFFEDGRVEIAASGTRIRVDRIVPDLVFPGYSHLGPVDAGWRADMRLGMVDMYADAAAHLDGLSEMRGCTPDQALATVAAIEAVHASARAEFRPQSVAP